VASISIVIATFNRALHLRAALEQLQDQAYEPGDEVIIVDNGSSDSTPDVIARAADAFSVPLRTLHESQNGKGFAMNAGIAAARGSVLALTDDDVVVADDWIATIRDLFRDPSLSLVGGRVDPNWERPAPAWLDVEQDGCYGPMSSPLALQHYGDAQPLGHRTAVGANMAVRRTLIEALGGFDTQLAPRSGTLLRAEDHEFCRRVLAAGYRSEYRPELRVKHWVPADRLRISYYLRWFFWSGVANAILGSSDPRDAKGARRAIPGYYLRQFLRRSLSAAHQFARGRPAAAAAAATDASFALGYVAHLRAPWWV